MNSGVVEFRGNCESDDSIQELEVPKKASPPLIEICDDDDDDIFINVTENSPTVSNTKIASKPDIIFLDEKPKQSNNAMDFNSPCHWTSDMIRFYNEDWGNENQFIVEKIQSKMDKTPYLWEISRRDFLRCGKRIRHRIYCNNCLQPGHVASKCPEEPYVPKCHMCGKSGHLSNKCPSSICLTCGNQTKTFTIYCNKCKNQSCQVCERCMMPGHNFINCPDHWRLFHLTTTGVEVKIPNKCIQKKEKDVWCCNCGRKGHYQNNCKNSRGIGAFKDTVPFVVSYQQDFRIHSMERKNGFPQKETNTTGGEIIKRGLQIIRKDIRNRMMRMRKNCKKEESYIFRSKPRKSWKRNKRKKSKKLRDDWNLFFPMGI